MYKMGFIKEFKEFAMKGNLVDLAISFVMGNEFKVFIISFIQVMVMTVVSLIKGKIIFQ